MFDFDFIKKNDDIEYKYRKEEVRPGVYDLHIDLKYSEKKAPGEFVVKWKLPVHEIISIWTPFSDYNRTLGKDWALTCSSSRLAVGAPVLACLDPKGNNVLTIGISDAKSPIDIDCGIIEETAELVCYVSFFVDAASPISEYCATVRLDARKISFVDTVMGIEQWWENDCGYKHAYVPEAARLPMNSAWYSFHQALDSDKILHECEISAKLGLKTIILDDGWQTDDNNRGYAYCGDWELAKSKISDMADLVERIHELGMKVMLWYSVPFVGFYSKAYSRFKDKALAVNNELKTIVLDPRYPVVRQYLTGIYLQALRDWNLDGFKLDFVDSFRISSDTKPYCQDMDIFSVEDAVDTLLNEITSSLKEINPEILIEFRQSYIGPSILKYGNMVRVGDCPYDSMTNRRAIIDLRLTSGDSAVHSDMIMWNERDSLEGACLQMLATLFGVPQISVLFDKLPDAHKKALAFWMDFYTKHRETLAGQISVKNPEIGYTQVTATKDNEAITVNYASLIVELKDVKKQIIINSTFDEYVTVKANRSFKATVFNCLGEKVNEYTLSQQLSMFPVAPCGIIELLVADD